MSEPYIPVKEQIVQLDNPIDRLWWFAQLERAIEVSTEREPIVGSEKVLNRITTEKEPLTDRDMFDMQFETTMLNLKAVEDNTSNTQWPDPRTDG